MNTKVKEFFGEIKKVDLKFLCLLLFATIVPIIYSSLRLIWVTGQGSDSYAMTSFNSYIQAFQEVISAFLIIPIFTYRKKDYDAKSDSLLIAITFASLMMFLILLSMMLPMANGMQKLNPDANRGQLMSYLGIMSAANAFQILETYLICEIALDKNTIKGVTIVFLSLVLRIIIDLLMISNIAIINFTIVNYAISTLISTLVIIFVLLLVYLFKRKSKEIKQNISLNEMFTFYKRGLLPGIDKFIANFFYTFVTLQIVNSLGEVEWNSWHLGMWIYWHVIFSITNIFKYSLYSETINNDQIDENKLTIFYCGIDFIIFAILSPILTMTTLKNVVDNGEWLELTVKTSLIMIPFMYSMAVTDNLKIRMIADNKFKFVLLNTLISNIVVELPAFIMLLCGYEFNYWENFGIWMAAISLSFILAIIFYWINLKTISKENNLKN